MGKRKQKVRWCIVDGLAWNNGNEEEGSTGEVGQLISPAPVAKGGEGVGGGGGRGGGRGGDGWGGTVAPRFERKAAAEQKHIYYEGEYCEAEELPNGFTKIRSKNLDILFKRDYYEQRLAVQQRLQSEQAEKEAAEEVTEEEHDTTEETRESTSTEEGSMGSTTGPAVIRATKSFDQMDPSEIPEFKPTNSRLQDLDGVDSGHTSPFYGNYSPYPTPQEYGYNQQAPPRPNLYLYSPSNNTLIPCEEIIIPNPVMSPEGPVYSGPTNIYLAYPVQGPDGRGYITQPFNGTNNPSGMTTSYSPPSCDSGTCFSSAPHTTPNSGQQ